MLKFKNVQKHYQNDGVVTEVFSSVTFDIDRPGLYVLSGESGSGKTTLLNLITRKINSDQGVIYINDENIYELSEEEWQQFQNENITLMQQESILNEKFTVEKNIEIICLANNIEFNKSLINKFLKYFEIPNQKVSELSNGEKQRANFVLTIIGPKNIVIFDEPTSSSDKVNSDKIIKYIEQLSKKTIVILATNKEEEIENISKHNLLISNLGIKKEEDYQKNNSICLMESLYETNYKFNSFDRHILNWLWANLRKYIYQSTLIILIMLISTLGIAYFVKEFDRVTKDNILYIQSQNHITLLEQLKSDNLILESTKFYKSFNEINLKTLGTKDEYLTYKVYSFLRSHKELFLDGRLPKELNEIVLPRKSKYKIGQTFEFSGEFFEIVGITDNEHVYIFEDFYQQKSFDNYLSKEGLIITNVKHNIIGKYEINVNKQLDNNTLVVYSEEENIDFNENSEIYIGNKKIDPNLIIEVIDDTKQYYEISEDLYFDILNIIQDKRSILLIENSKKYQLIKSKIDDDDLIYYPYINDESMVQGVINKEKLTEIILIIFFAAFITLTTQVMSVYFNQKNNFVKKIEQTYDKKELTQLYLVESLLMIVISIIIIVINNLIMFNYNNKLTYVKNSSLLPFYYIIPIIITIFIISNRIYKKEKIEND